METILGFCGGHTELLKRRKCVLLNSRQSKRPTRKDPWILSSQRAIDRLLGENWCFVTSTGMNTWEIILHLVNVSGGTQVILLPASNEEEFKALVSSTISDFSLSETRCCFVQIPTPVNKHSERKKFWPERDQRAVEISDTIVPVSLRSGGNLAGLLDNAIKSTKSVNDNFQIPYRAASEKMRYDFSKVVLNPILGKTPWNYLSHWTRSSHIPYPGESRFDYYKSILESDSYSHSAFKTLERIVLSNKITSSSRFIRGGSRVVSFTELSPFEVVELIRWRSRYVYYSFEPYAIAIDRRWAESNGLRPVIYGDDAAFEYLNEQDKSFFQKAGSIVADWRPEYEWRCAGDFLLGKVPMEKIRIITFTESEAEAIRRTTDHEVFPLTLGS